MSRVIRVVSLRRHRAALLPLPVVLLVLLCVSQSMVQGVADLHAADDETGVDH